MEEWKEFKLGDVLTIKYGKDHKQLADGDIPIYGSGGIMRYGERSLYEGPSILIPRKGSLNNIIYSDKPFWTVDTMFWTIINEEIANPLFVYYSICKKDFASLNVGSAVPSLTVPVIEDIEILLPSKNTQDKIVDILKSLDDKIEVNRRINDNFVIDSFFQILLIWMLIMPINDNLEQQAQALFKSWFVDFEPFKDGEFVESELGMIPKGWRVGKLGEICKCILGGTPSRNKESYWNGNIPWINSGEVNEFRIIKPSEYITQEGLDHSATKLLPKKTTVLAITGATLGQVSLLEIDSCANQSVIGVLENETIPYEFIYPLVNDRINELCSHMTGGAQQHINKNNVEQLDVIIPQQDVMSLYRDKTKAIYAHIGNLCFESHRLAELRDTLLPKLMSGEIKVEDVTFTKKAMTIEK